MKTGTLTFHGSHNYGSMLQAYALQKIMINIFGHNEIINLRTKRQDRMNYPLSFPLTLRGFIKTLISFLFLKSLFKKFRLFEDFLSNNLILSSTKLETVTSDDIASYDLICSGSDQIWNPNPVDFDISYYQPFSFKGIKIAYAPSMGPEGIVSKNLYSKYKKYLNKFDSISVREEGSKKKVEEISGRKDIEVLCDPVLLLEKSNWEESFIDYMFKQKIFNGKPYIFMYTLYSDKLSTQCALKLSNQMKLPVIVSSFTNFMAIVSGRITKKIDVGPIEFLNLIYFSEAIVTTSFHGTAFSIIFNKPFIAVNGMSDNRISNILNKCNLTECAVSDLNEVCKSKLYNIDFANANELINSERLKAISYLEHIKNTTANGRADM